MEKGIKKIAYSTVYYKNSENVYSFGLDSFGALLSDLFFERLQSIIDELEFQYNLHPECKHLPSKGKIYRNIIFGKYLVIYRITPNKVEVLALLHSSRSVKKIKATRSIKTV
jgi:toxin ParE1/3/4